MWKTEGSTDAERKGVKKPVSSQRPCKFVQRRNRSWKSWVTGLKKLYRLGAKWATRTIRRHSIFPAKKFFLLGQLDTFAKKSIQRGALLVFWSTDDFDPSTVEHFLQRCNTNEVLVTDSLLLWTTFQSDHLLFLPNSSRLAISQSLISHYVARLTGFRGEITVLPLANFSSSSSSKKANCGTNSKSKGTVEGPHQEPARSGPSRAHQPLRNLAINLVDYEEGGWILSEISSRLRDSLCDLGHDVEISPSPLKGFDVIHHIIFLGIPNHLPEATHSSMVTHLDRKSKRSLVQQQMENGILPIAMSQETSKQIGRIKTGAMSGNAPYVILPPFLGRRVPSVKVAILTRTYDDGRKREFELERLAKEFSPKDIGFNIMGRGWDRQVGRLKGLGYTVDYEPEFAQEKYVAFIDSADFLVYTGWDEGAVSCIDALARGKKVIAPGIGYHLDYRNPLFFFAARSKEAAQIIKKELEERESLMPRTGYPSWESYALDHLQIWNFALARPLERDPYTFG